MRKGAYARSGVDINAVKGLHGMMAESLSETFRYRSGMPGEPLLGIGHYAGVISLGGGRALALHADGVGTKVIVAQQMRKYDTVGIDCVAMTVNDLICLGSEPLALVDYIALEREDEQLVAAVLKGLKAGSRKAAVSIVGGETAIMGDVIKGFDGHGFDLAAMGVGLVDPRVMVDGSKIAVGDVVLGLRSSGLHSNGYTLVRKIFADRDLSEPVPELGRTLGEELLAPTEIYVKPVLAVLKTAEVHGLAHITGGAFSKLTRLTKGRDLRFRFDEMPPPPIFRMLKKAGRLATAEMYRTFNMGVGFCIVAPRSEAEDIVSTCSRFGAKASVVGAVERGSGVYVGKLRIS